MNACPTVTSAPSLLYKAIGATILSFIPVICIVGILLGLSTLQKTLKTKDQIAKILSIIAIVVGALCLLQTALAIIFLMSATQPVPDFGANGGFVK
jgi:hypothetical protein